MAEPMSDLSPEASGAPQPVQPLHIVEIPSSVPMVSLLGPRDELLRTLERQFPHASIHVRGNEFRMTGPSADIALIERTLDELLAVLAAGQPLNRDAVERSIGMLRSQSAERPADVLTMNIVSNRGRTIRPKTLNQKHYVDAIDAHTIVFGIGPAGTGKTYLAMAKAVAALQAKQVNRIILTRPAVEAGERLGFLPGTLNDKIDPYLRPLYDALHDMIDPESIPRLMAAGTIEVAPLAYMRGRAQPLDSQVLTPDGFRRFGDLQVGDYVIGSDGRATEVLGVYPQGRKPIYRVTTQDGASTLCCGEHLWTVDTVGFDASPMWRVLDTTEIAALLPTTSVRLPVVAPVEFASESVRPARPSRSWDMPGDTLVAQIPADVLSGTLATRRGFLRRLLDGQLRPVDGRDSVTSEGIPCAVPTEMLDALLFVVRSLGGLASVGGPDAVGRHAVTLEVPDSIYHGQDDAGVPGRLIGQAGCPMRFIDRIEPAGEADVMCIKVAAEDSLYVTDDFLVTHNTLNDAFIILDEAQNTSPEQMKMFLTRLGFGSKIVVTGDVTQVDLPGGTQSGLKVVQDILRGIEDVHFANLTSVDVVRHRLVGDIVDAYGRWDSLQHKHSGPGRTTGERRRPQRD